ncbi:hypothetical protein [uncultured Castellaniella sp.]|uniref:hypothetical protein n=1 Tax=uncultured Castellaniella sp. TaxID=647907 RepID=UPI0026304DDF|nr:hypothetical protein [uncultured Castellaniella sp.]
MKYIVIRPWYGVEKGAVVDLKHLHPALKTNVRPIGGEAAELVPATPGAGGKPPTKGEIAKRLKELGIEFDGRQSAAELLTLLPDGDPLKTAAE